MLKRTERDLETLFDSACSFQEVYSHLAAHNASMGMAAGEIKQLAIKLCEKLSVEDIGEVNISRCIIIQFGTLKTGSCARHSKAFKERDQGKERLVHTVCACV